MVLNFLFYIFYSYLIIILVFFLIQFLKKRLNILYVYSIYNILYCLITIISFLIIYNSIINSLNYLSIVNISHSFETIVYKCFGIWGTSNGSFFVFLWFLIFYNLLYQLIFYKHLNNLFFNQIFFTVLFTSILTNLIHYSFNPFLNSIELIFDGFNLNPLLHDIGLIIHPPILYFGYIGCIFICLVKFKQFFEKQHLKFFYNHNYVLTIVIFLTLTFSIVLGSWWAYHELGWGGFWFWDVVENIALIVWLFIFILFHLYFKQLNFLLFNKLYYYVGFILFNFIFFSIYLVRSSLLNSVHLFIKNNYLIYLLILPFIFFYTLFFILNKFYNLKEDKNKKSFFSINHLVILNLIFYASLFLVLVLSYSLLPIFGNLFLKKEFIIHASNYNLLLFYLIIPVTFLLTLVSLTKSNTKITINWYYLILICFFNYFLINFININNLFNNNWFLLLLFLILGYNCYLLKKINIKLFNFSYSHIGFILLIMSLILVTQSKFEYLNYINNTEYISILNNYKVMFNNFNFIDNNLYRFFYSISHFYNTDIQKNLINLLNEKHFYILNNQFTTKSIILTNFFNDFYSLISIGNLQSGWLIRIFIVSFMSLVWLSSLILLFGLILTLFKQTSLKKAGFKFI